MEKVVFVMPHDKEMFLAALAAVQGWQNEQALQIEHGLKHTTELAKKNEQIYAARKMDFGQYQMLCVKIEASRQELLNRKYELHVILQSTDLDILNPAFGKDTVFHYYDPPLDVLTNCDLYFKFDPDKAWEIGNPTQRHVTQTFGLLVGAETDSLPDLSEVEWHPPDKEKAVVDVLILAWENAPDIANYLSKNKPDHSVWVVGHANPKMVASANMVVGKRSFETYLASALNKRVVELYPDDKYRGWLTKWENPNYQMVYGHDFPAGMVWRAMETLWSRPRIVKDKEERHKLSKRTTLGGLSVGTDQVPF